jgi:hypothetical protein
MPHQPDLLRHDTHDLELVAAYVAGDTTGPDQDTAAALATGCAACATAAAELRAIARALPALPPPRRTRDYRLDPATAARLRPTGWRSLLAPLATRRFAFAAPLGTALATLGLAGLLVVGLPGALPGAGGAADRGTTTDVGFPTPAAPPVPAGGHPTVVPVYGSGTDTGSALGPEGGGGGESRGGEQTGASPTVAPETGGDGASEALQVAGGTGLVTLLAAVCLVGGVGLVALRWSARRFA